ncbi:MAG: hypothetical protein AABW52_03185 [Nanoarchaeota archaeon]
MSKLARDVRNVIVVYNSRFADYREIVSELARGNYFRALERCIPMEPVLGDDPEFNRLHNSAYLGTMAERLLSKIEADCGNVETLQNFLPVVWSYIRANPIASFIHMKRFIVLEKRLS